MATAATPLTRLNSDVFLIGQCELEPLSTLRQLPTRKQVLQRFHHHLKIVKSVRNASHLTIEELSLLWSAAAIPMTLTKHAIEKLEKFHTSWLMLKKNKSRPSEVQRKREVGFVNELNALFDISHAEAMTMITINEDRDFLVDQRGIRLMFIAAEDKKLAKKLE